MARSMLKFKGLSNELWEEAITCLVCSLNKYPKKSVKEKIPYEVQTGKKPNVSHFRIFSCVAYTHILEEIRKRLDDRGEK